MLKNTIMQDNFYSKYTTFVKFAKALCLHRLLPRPHKYPVHCGCVIDNSIVRHDVISPVTGILVFTVTV
jgi:hypothetical protein